MNIMLEVSKEEKKLNPHQMKADYEKHKHPSAPGGKFYLPAFVYNGRKIEIKTLYYKTATAAQERAKAVILRWRRLYDAWVVFEAKKVLEQGE